MNTSLAVLTRQGGLLAVNLLFLMVWGFASIDKLRHGKPDWFADKFGKTVLGIFPGLSATFWLLTAAGTAGFLLAILALLRGDFCRRDGAPWLAAMVAWSLFVFLQLGFGQWLTDDYLSAHQQFMYFSGTLVALIYVTGQFGLADSSGKK